MFTTALSLLLRVTLLPVFVGAPTAATGRTPGPPPAPAAVTPAPAAVTDAERIANAHASIKQAREGVEKIQARLDDPNGEYQKAKTEFEALNEKQKDLKAAAAKARKDGKEAEAVAHEAALKTVQDDWQLAKERFDIAILQRKASQEAMAGLKERIASEQQLVDRLEGKAPASPAPSPAPTPAPTPVAQPAPPADVKPKPVVDPVAIATGGVVPTPAAPSAPAPAPAPEAKPTPAADPSPAADNDPAVRAARELVATRRAELREAEERGKAVAERVRVMERSIQAADKILGLERESAAQSEKAVTHMKATPPPADAAERDALAKRLADAELRLAESRGRAQRIADRVAELNESLAALRAEQDAAAADQAAAQQRAAAAQADLDALISPTSPRRLLRWVVDKGPRLLLIVVGMVVVHLVVRQFSRHIVRFITRNSVRGSQDDRENRAQTLVGVFRYVAGLVVFGGGLVMLLDEVGVPIVPLMGGAAVVGLAVAFGAQNLIRDYFTGFMMLMEDQYSVNDVVRVGAISGLVEQITLRMTVLRDLEGVRHFIPHGTVTSVSNLTHGWSRALLDVPVAYKENVDRVIAVLMELGRELRIDPVLGRHILENPEMLGVEALSDSGVVVRFLLKTRPLQQWPVKREMLRRIKNRFEELGIEISVPQRTVFHRFPDGAAAMPPHEYARPAA